MSHEGGYLTPRQLSEVLGHTEGFWREALDGRKVVGHRSGSRKNPRTGKVVGQRFISVASAKKYLAGLDAGVSGIALQEATGARGSAVRVEAAAFRRRWRALQAG